MKRIVLNKFFYICFIICIAIYFSIFKSDVFSFSRIGEFFAKKNVQVGNDYIRSDAIDDTAFGLAMANIKVLKGTSSDVSSSSLYLDNTVDSLVSAKLLINVNPTSLVKDSANKKNALETHIKQLESLRDKLSDASEQFLSMSDESKSSASQCLENKNAGDSNFFDGLNNNNKDSLKEGLQTSSENGPCYIKNRIYANAYYNLYTKANLYKGVLDQKITLLNENADTIVQNYKLFEDSYLENLTTLRNKINQYGTTGSSTTQTE